MVERRLSQRRNRDPLGREAAELARSDDASERSHTTPILSNSPRYLKHIWVTRLCFGLVFIVNMQCALQFVVNPAGFMGGFGLSGPTGQLAVAGLGIAFLMWNTTYPLFIWQPQRFGVLGAVIIAQQIIGLVGETALYLGLGELSTVVGPAILRFICFDAVGLVLMSAGFALFCRSQRIIPATSHRS